jgi:hypothetical protein
VTIPLWLGLLLLVVLYVPFILTLDCLREHAQRKGYQLGWHDADRWWCGVEEDVEAERRRMWLEESEKR